MAIFYKRGRETDNLERRERAISDRISERGIAGRLQIIGNKGETNGPTPGHLASQGRPIPRQFDHCFHASQKERCQRACNFSFFLFFFFFLFDRIVLT